MVTRKTTSNVRANALRHGWRSGLEEKVANALTEAGIPFTYEKTKVKYIKPASEHQYTPDFVLDNGIIIETKGLFTAIDRQKHILVKRQHPHFGKEKGISNSKQRLSKASRTTYGMWCEKNGYLYADKMIPEHWINERRRSVKDGRRIDT
jgi:ribosomal protein L39E